MTQRALQRALDGALFTLDVFAWCAGVALILALVVMTAAVVYGTSRLVAHRVHVTRTARRLRRQVG